MKRLNILFLVPSLNIGGAERHIYSLVLNLKKERFNPIIVCLYELGKVGSELIASGLEVHHGLMRHELDIPGALRILSIIKSKRIDIIYAIHSPLSLFWGTVWKRLAPVKSLITRVTSTRPIYNYKKIRIANLLFLPFVDRIICQADSHRERVMAIQRIDPRKIEVIYNGIDLRWFDNLLNRSEMRVTQEIPRNQPIVGIVSRLRTEKGLSTFLESARIIHKSLKDIHFLIIGDGDQRGYLEKMAEDFMIYKNVHFLGEVINVAPFISLFDVGVTASAAAYEAFPNALLEYMAASKPVVATDAGSIPEVVVNNKTGFVIPAKDAKAMADAISRLLIDKKLAEEMGKAGRRRVEEKFTIEHMIKRYESLFEDLGRRD